MLRRGRLHTCRTGCPAFSALRIRMKYRIISNVCLSVISEIEQYYYHGNSQKLWPNLEMITLTSQTGPDTEHHTVCEFGILFMVFTTRLLRIPNSRTGLPCLQVFRSGGRGFEVRFRHSFTGIVVGVPKLFLWGPPDD